MIKPPELSTERGEDIWRVITAAEAGDTSTLHSMLSRDSSLSREQYWYTPPIHFAVREGHSEATKILLAAGADAEWNGHYGNSLIDMAKERGHNDVVRVLEANRAERGRPVSATTAVDHPIHAAAEAGDVRGVQQSLKDDPTLLERADREGCTPLHRAVIGRSRSVIELLLQRGANIHAILDSPSGYSPRDLQAIDLAIWGGRRRTVRPPLWRIAWRIARYWLGRKRIAGTGPCDIGTARLLIARGAAYDLTVAAALGDLDQVRTILDADPSQIRSARPNGRRPLSSAVEFGHDDIVRLLLERGVDPTWPEGDATRGSALHTAARDGNFPLVQLLIAHGADPNAYVDSSGNSVYIAKTPEIRAYLKAHGGTLDPYDLIWLGEEDEVMRRVTEDPSSAELGCGGVFTAVCTLGKRDLLKRLLDAGIRVPPLLTGCQSYLLERADMLQTLLESGMNPDTCNWQNQTMLHMVCGQTKPGENSITCAKLLLDAGANISARDDEYRSTPLAWAARSNRRDLVELLLSRGAPARLPDDKSWATPLAWATRRGYAEIAELLRAAGG